MREEPADDLTTLSVESRYRSWRLDAFLVERLGRFSRAFLQKLIQEGRVRVDGCICKPASRLHGGETIVLQIPAPQPAAPVPQPIELEVLFEDRHLLVLNKPAGLVVHPAPGNPDHTLVNALLHRCRDLSGIGGVMRPGIVHRLDRDTSGVMLVSKTDVAHRRLAQMFGARQVHKTYQAFCIRRSGATPLADSGCFDTSFGRHPTQRKRFSSRVEKGRRAITEWRVEQRYRIKELDLLHLSLRPQTGRTHQLRVHLSDAGYPIMGDKLYGGRTVRSLPEELIPPRQALHASRLAFRHPIEGRQLEFFAPLPPDLQELVCKLERASRGCG